MLDHDRRSETRLDLPLKLRLRPVHPEEEQFIQLILEDVCNGGISFTCSQSLSLLKKYELELYLDELLVAKAIIRLIWSRILNQSQLYGAYFVQLSMEHREKLQALLAIGIENSTNKDRRINNRRTGTSPYNAATFNHRRVERRSAARLREREGIARRFLSKDLKQILNRRVVITGLGVVSPIGIGKESFLSALQEGVSGIRPLTRFNADEFPCRFGGEVVQFNVNDYISSKKISRMDLATQMAVVSALLAIKDSCINVNSENRRRIGVAMGTTMGGLGWIFDQYKIWQEKGQSNIHPYTIAAASPNACSGEIAAELQINGPVVSFSQGCTSGAGAIAYSFEQIRSGQVDLMLSGGCEAPFVSYIYGAFCRSGIMANTNGSDGRIPKPFSKNRTGIVLAEGAAILILEELEHALARKASIYAEITGTSSTCDGYDMIQPRSDGSESMRALSLALDEAEILPGEIDAIFTQASGSRNSDAIELMVLKRIFGKDLDRIMIANTKSMLGYAQGATAAIDCVAAALSFQNKFIPPVLNVDNPEIPLNISAKARHADLRAVAVDCFGFGGKNICLILERFNA